MQNVSINQPNGDVVINMKWPERRLHPINQDTLDCNDILKSDQNSDC